MNLSQIQQVTVCFLCAVKLFKWFSQSLEKQNLKPSKVLNFDCFLCKGCWNCWKGRPLMCSFLLCLNLHLHPVFKNGISLAIRSFHDLLWHLNALQRARDHSFGCLGSLRPDGQPFQLQEVEYYDQTDVLQITLDDSSWINPTLRPIQCHGLHSTRFHESG